MKLYVTTTSPYARLAMIVMHDKGLSDQVDLVWTRTRQPEDPLLSVNPSGRVPFLMLADGTGMEETDLIVDYFDALVMPRNYSVPEGDEHWPFRRFEATARSMLDGTSVWAREIKRPPEKQSSEVLDHERRRAIRLADYFEGAIYDKVFQIGLTKPQILLFCALDLERRIPHFSWRTEHPNLRGWFQRMEDLPAVIKSLPPENT
ncbi:MAG: putative GST-like protein YibF [Alphaproteobacteria bacterium MarineAlpha11_Bin1]|nr:MAG: putative GST-like protein YibF [Alphaproteobacteria bacterium MarineAlpha11_Bin1]